jgi:hypothetical protein
MHSRVVGTWLRASNWRGVRDVAGEAAGAAGVGEAVGVCSPGVAAGRVTGDGVSVGDVVASAAGRG